MFACGKKEIDARTYLDSALTCYNNADYRAAQNILDTLRVLFPDRPDIHREARQLRRLVEFEQQQQIRSRCDSLLQIRLAQRDVMKANFLFEKDPEYDEIGRYYAESQELENNLQRSYIRCAVDERGAMELMSIYYGGRPVGHTGLKVTGAKGDYAETEIIPYDGGMNYSFTDLNMITETVTYAGGKDNGVILFIYNNMNAPLKAEYTGGKKKYAITISHADKHALADIRDFSVVLSDIDRLNKAIVKVSERIAYLQEQLSAGEEM
jgi:hypothetical protein